MVRTSSAPGRNSPPNQTNQARLGETSKTDLLFTTRFIITHHNSKETTLKSKSLLYKTFGFFFPLASVYPISYVNDRVLEIGYLIAQQVEHEAR